MASAKLIQRTPVIRSRRKMKASTAVVMGRVSISNAALLASDMRVPQVIKTWPGKMPSKASRKKASKSRG